MLQYLLECVTIHLLGRSTTTQVSHNTSLGRLTARVVPTLTIQFQPHSKYKDHGNFLLCLSVTSGQTIIEGPGTPSNLVSTLS